MPELTKHEPGSFSWIELATTDTAGGKAFYTALFGWTFVDTPAGPDMVYTRFQLRGKDVAALYPQPKEQRDQGVPPNWGSYVSVESADGTAAKARELGGRVLLEPFDVFDYGRMAVVEDPTGAIFSIWEARTHIGVQVLGEPNSLCWNELYTRDTAAALKFYSALFAWRPKTDAGGYTEWLISDRAVGGMIQIAPEWGPMPPNWTPYFLVEDCDATAQRALQLGGRQLVPARDIENVGRFTMIQDPQGACFAIIKLTQRE
jgi:uncharacterized protein